MQVSNRKEDIMNTLYPKIPVLFKRSEDGNKNFIYGAYRHPLVEYLKDCPWRFYEKIDGTNIRIIWDGHKVSFGGRTDKANIPGSLMNRLNDLFGGSANEELFEQKFGEHEVVLFGEGFGPGIQKGGSYLDHVDFILFDVKVGDYWLNEDDIADVANSFGIKMVPFVMEGTIDDAINYVATNPKSAFDTAVAEGVVGRPKVQVFDRNGERMIVKIKYCDIKDMVR